MQIDEKTRAELEHIRYALETHRAVTAALRDEGIAPEIRFGAVMAHAVGLSVHFGFTDDELVEQVLRLRRAARDPQPLPIGSSGLV